MKVYSVKMSDLEKHPELGWTAAKVIQAIENGELPGQPLIEPPSPRVPGGPFHLARILALALDPQRQSPDDTLAPFQAAEVGDVDQTRAGNGQFRATWIDNDRPGPDKRVSFIVSVREAS